jgi:hypothetical protein
MIESLIKSIPGWQLLSTEEIWDALTQKSIKKTDQKKWKSIDLAKLIGWDQVDGFFSYLAQNRCQWVVNLAAGDGLPIGDDDVNFALKGFDNPVCKQLAGLGVCYVSILENAEIETTFEIIECVVSEIRSNAMLMDEKNSLIEFNALRWNAFVDAVNQWDGTGPKPEL